MPKGAIFKKECKKVLFNRFAVMQFSLFDQLFFPAKKQNFSQKIKFALLYKLILFAKFVLPLFFPL